MYLCINTAFAENLVLNPVDDFLGEIPQITVCAFKYGPGTILTKNTRITVDPYTEKYGPNSVINEGDGMTCSNCFVNRLEMSNNGVTTLYCTTLDSSLSTEIKF